MDRQDYPLQELAPRYPFFQVAHTSSDSNLRIPESRRPDEAIKRGLPAVSNLGYGDVAKIREAITKRDHHGTSYDEHVGALAYEGYSHKSLPDQPSAHPKTVPPADSARQHQSQTPANEASQRRSWIPRNETCWCGINIGGQTTTTTGGICKESQLEYGNAR